MRDLYLVSLKRMDIWYPVIAFDEEDKAKIYCYDMAHNGEYRIALIIYSPTY